MRPTKAFVDAIRHLLRPKRVPPAELCPECARLWERSGRSRNAACRHHHRDH